jgi:pimeloyl-ACP methyl ester carboxylesterase
MAGDIGDLMTVLPYDQWNLFGVSYGTRVALVTMRRPAGGDPQCHTRFGPAHRWP